MKIIETRLVCVFAMYVDKQRNLIFPQITLFLSSRLFFRGFLSIIQHPQFLCNNFHTHNRFYSKNSDMKVKNANFPRHPSQLTKKSTKLRFPTFKTSSTCFRLSYKLSETTFHKKNTQMTRKFKFLFELDNSR